MKFIYLSLALAALVILTGRTTFSVPSSISGDSVCFVSQEKIEGEGIKYNYLGKEVTFCCEGCEKSFRKNPAKFIEAGGLTCPICGHDDASNDMSSVYNDTKYYFCAEGCKTAFEKNPEEYLSKYSSK